MNLKSILIAASVGWATATAAFCADPLTEHQASMTTGARVPQPVGHYYFCKAYPSECGQTASVGKTASLTEVAWHVIKEVNANVNGKITQVTDLEYYGEPELWTYPKSAGDCEDFALMKKKELEARGFQEADLLVTVVKKPDGAGHAILTVRTSEGDFVLDNLDDRVKRWWQTPYRFEKRQSSLDSAQWVLIEQVEKDVPVAAVLN
ncbi:transglutaminase-like cysteine peptidase [Rhizobium sp. TH2]|uniref:transglutaminase-like cysteine peptidase n=1 Tax=Rhizobium sp. TH2 TaxID=2775403 RepID=UPI0035BE431E